MAYDPNSGVVFDPKIHSPYHYVPSQSVAIIMLAVFALSTVLHVGQAIKFRTWYIIPTAVLCGCMELGGWAARLWSHYEPWASTPFRIQITAAILAPTPLLAATFIIFGHIIDRLGSSYSRLSTRLYTIIFCTCDVVALVVQGVGGGVAASGDDDRATVDLGSNIMLAGVIFQLTVIVVFTACAGEYLVRYYKDRPLTSSRPRKSPRGYLTRKLKIMLGALGLSAIALFTRAVYRTIELADGWGGRIITNELLFNVLDGAMVVLAMYAINIFHPGLLLANYPTHGTGQVELKGTGSANGSAAALYTSV